MIDGDWWWCLSSRGIGSEVMAWKFGWYIV